MGSGGWAEEVRVLRRAREAAEGRAEAAEREARRLRAMLHQAEDEIAALSQIVASHREETGGRPRARQAAHWHSPAATPFNLKIDQLQRRRQSRSPPASHNNLKEADWGEGGGLGAEKSVVGSGTYAKGTAVHLTPHEKGQAVVEALGPCVAQLADLKHEVRTLSAERNAWGEADRAVTAAVSRTEKRVANVEAAVTRLSAAFPALRELQSRRSRDQLSSQIALMIASRDLHTRSRGRNRDSARGRAEARSELANVKDGPGSRETGMSSSWSLALNLESRRGPHALESSLARSHLGGGPTTRSTGRAALPANLNLNESVVSSSTSAPLQLSSLSSGSDSGGEQQRARSCRLKRAGRRSVGNGNSDVSFMGGRDEGQGRDSSSEASAEDCPRASRRLLQLQQAQSRARSGLFEF